MPRIRLPTGQVLVFPDDATPEEIEAEANRIAGPQPGERLQALIETGAPVAGAIAGGALAGPGGPASAGLGAGLGAAAGQQLSEITRPLLTGQESTLAESVTRTGFAGVLGLLGEGAGQAAMRLVGKVLAPFAKKVSPEAMKAQAALERVGVTGAMTPAQLTESRLLDVSESIAESSLFGAGRLQAARRKLTEEGIPALVDDLLTQLGTKISPTQIGQLLAQSRTAAIEVFKGAKRTLYGKVDQLAKGVVVDTQPVVTFIRKTLARQSRTVERALSAADVSVDDLLSVAGPPSRVASKATTLAEAQMEAVRGAVPAQKTPETTFRIAQEIRSKLLTVARKKPLSVDDQAVVNVAGKLAGLVDDQMEAAASRMAPEALTAFRAANEFNKLGIDRLENELIRGLAKRMAKQPSTIVPLLAAPNKADVLRTVKAAVDPATFERFQEAMTTHVIGKAADAKTGIVSGAGLLQQLKNLGDETAQLVFKNKGAVEDLGRTIELLQRKVAKEGTGRIFIQLKQAGAATEVAGAVLTFKGFQKTGVAILMAPAVVGRLFTNPVAVRWLTRGFQAGPGTEGFFRAMSQVVALSQPTKKAGETAVQISGERLRQIQELLR